MTQPDRLEAPLFSEMQILTAMGKVEDFPSDLACRFLEALGKLNSATFVHNGPAVLPTGQILPELDSYQIWTRETDHGTLPD